MTINFEYVGVDVSEMLNAFTTEKLDKLFNRYEFLISATVRFKKNENDPVKGEICDIELSLPGPRVFATSDEKKYEVAVRETIKDLEKQLKKRKETFSTH
ncbi:MAG: HPF/RaiA family ribosome-associated protein [Oceanihabitans sp.]|jgi:ribosomal subunit interface protein|nr:HPF/RaiA family ribosome-associated protein [Oceanihabitans sp.]